MATKHATGLRTEGLCWSNVLLLICYRRWQAQHSV